MRYKLVRSFPGSPEVGAIFIGSDKGGTHYAHQNTSYYLRREDVESSPEFFAPFLFTTLDSKDVFVGDEYFYVNDNRIEKLTAYGPTSYGYKNIQSKAFSSKEAAQKWIDEQNKPKFEVGEWLYFQNQDFYGIFRFESYREYGVFTSTESYWFPKKNFLDYKVDVPNTTGTFDKNWNIRKASHAIIESILIKVAVHKGFKEGVKYYPINTYGNYVDKRHAFVCTGNFAWYPASEALVYNGNIYVNGKWAEIVKEEVVPEYVECVKSVSSAYEFGKIYKVNTNGFVIGEGGLKKHTVSYWNNSNDGYSKFKPSTKDEYELQEGCEKLKQDLQDYINRQKTLIVNVPGEITSMSQHGSEVKINYK